MSIFDIGPGRPLLAPVMEQGRRLQPPEPLSAIRDRVRAQLATLPEALRAHQTAPPYPVDIAPELRDLAAQLDRESH